jgi:UDP-2-acetamido-3-amino-2,3-dideoxy-glucuronate N-acetyltransferase
LGALAAVVDGDPVTAGKMADTYRVPALGFDDVLADPAIHGVALATPAPTHVALALKAIAAGKHVYVEKPLALDPAEARTVINAANAAGVTLMVGHLLQYHPIFIKMLEMEKGGEIGTLQYVYSNRLSLGKFRIEENVLWSFAPHDFSMILALAGAEPTSVTAQGAAFLSSGIADWATCQFAFPNGVRGHIQASWLHPFKEHRLVAIGSDGMIMFEDSEPDWTKKLTIYRHKIDRSGTVPAPVKADAEFVAVENGEPLRNECQHFLDCIDQNKTPTTDGEEGLRVLNALHLAELQLQKSLSE